MGRGDRAGLRIRAVFGVERRPCWTENKSYVVWERGPCWTDNKSIVVGERGTCRTENTPYYKHLYYDGY